MTPATGQETGQAILGYLAYMVEINKETSPLLSGTDGYYSLVYNGSANPDLTQLAIRSVGDSPVKAGYQYGIKVQALYINGPTV